METRIRRNIIILVVLTFLLLIGMGAGWFFVLVRPQKEEIAKTDKEYSALKVDAAKLKGAMEDERKAKDKLEYLEGQLNFFRGSSTTERINGLYRRLYFGEIDGGSELNIAARQEAWRRWMNEYHYAYGPALTAELTRLRTQANVKFDIPSIKVDDPPQKPEDVKPPTNGFMKPLSASGGGSLNLTVTGTFNDILRLLETINHSSILLVVGQIKLTGNSPNLQATFPITPYLLAVGPAIKGAAPAPAPVAPATDEGGGDAADKAKEKTNQEGRVVGGVKLQQVEAR